MASQPGSSAPAHRAAEIDVDEARKAFFLMVGFIGLIWVLQVANWADHYHLDASFGILPRSLGHLGDIFIAPFLHFSWDHIEGNSGPLFVFGLLAAYRGVTRFLGVTLLVAITSGLIFGYFGYVLARGLIDRNLIDALAAVVMALSYAYILTVAIPGTPGVSWIGHLGGLVGGLAAGWIFRTRRRAPRAVRTQPPPADSSRLPRQPGTAVDLTSANPRADLHRELGEMGL